MKLRVLGASGGAGRGLETTALLFNERALIDAGTGVGNLSIEELCLIEHVFFTHSHLDHVAFLPLMADTVFSRHPSQILMHGEEETLQAICKHILNWTIWPDFTVLSHHRLPCLAVKAHNPGETVTVDNLNFTLVPVSHSVQAVGYIVENDNSALAFSGDTGPNTTFWQALNQKEKLDMLIVEAAFPNRMKKIAEMSSHYCPETLAEDIKQLRHRPPLYITHLKPGFEQEIMDECRQAIEGFELHALEEGREYRFP